MKFTFSWLKEHLETGASLAEVAERLTMLGIEVESIVDRGAQLSSFVVARVLEASPHPNADKLRVCRVDTGTGQVQVVCGAPNARTGLTSVFAPEGSFIPGTGITLKPAAIRGVDSAGMLLSGRELGLSDDHDGIVELAGEWDVGMPAAAALGVADPMIEVAVTPNRADCLGVRGIARDLAAASLGYLRPLADPAVTGGFESPVIVRLDLSSEVAAACPRFVGRTIRGVRNGESPRWMQDRLKAIGLRPISALVDITNYMAFDLCRPLHVFDVDRLRGNLHVRMARAGETLDGLGGRVYALGPEMTVIADQEGPVALGGVLGGVRTGCTDATTTVFIESALFDPIRTAQTGRRLAIQSDARYRFERGIDPCFLDRGLEMASRLVLDICGGEASRIVRAGAEPPIRTAIAFRPDGVRTLAGVEADPGEMGDALERLGFQVAKGETSWSVVPPSWRGDVEGEACLVEEVIRILGYDRISTALLPRATSLPAPVLTLPQRRRAVARRVLAGRGLIEAVTFSFVSDEAAKAFKQTPAALRLVNPISADLDVMRPSLLPHLLLSAQRNADRGIRDGALFEVGPEYAGDRPGDQSTVAAGIRFGRTGPRNWAQPPRPIDSFDAKADALAVLDALGATGGRLTVTADAPAWYHPGRSGHLRLGQGSVLARFGEVHPRVLRRLDVRGPVVAFEVLLDALPEKKVRRNAKAPLALANLQAVERDFAFVVDDQVTADQVIRAARSAGRDLIAQVRVFDVFTGGALGEGRKSIAITVTLQPVERTLVDAEIEAIAAEIVERVAEQTGGVLRT